MAGYVYITRPLKDYKVPVYETKASVEDTQEQEDEVPVVKTSTEEETKEDEAAEEEEQAKGSFDLEDGVYQGSGTGYRGNITVAVTIQRQTDHIHRDF